MSEDKDVGVWASIIVIIVALGIWAICTKALVAIVLLFAFALGGAILFPILLWYGE